MKARSPHRDSILAFLKEHGPTKVGDLVVALGVERKHVSKVVSRMARSGEIVTTDFTINGAGGGRLCQLPDLSTLVNPQPVSNVPLAQSNVRRDQKIPAWNPGVEYDNDGGELRTPPVAVPAPPAAWVEPDEQDIFSHFDMDSSVWRITNLRRSKWQSGSGDWLEAYRASFVKRAGANLAAFTEDELTELLGSYSASYGAPVQSSSNRIMVVPVGDQQIGKPEGGGTEATIARFARLTQKIADKLQAEGGCKGLILPWLGDGCEGLVSQSGRNVARLDIAITEQVRVLRRLMLHQIITFAPLAEKILVPVVNGNHDIAFKDQTMEPGDGWQIEAGSATADALALSEKFEHVQFIFPPKEEWGVSVNVMSEENPYVIHFTHGHQARNPDKVKDWWSAQTFGRQTSGAADMLMTGHFHHLRLENITGNRTWCQVPSLDGGSDYYRASKGEEVPSGMLAFDIVGGETGWTNLSKHT